METIGERIRKLRKALNLTQNQLAQKVGGKSASAVTQWETNGTKPSGENLLILAAALKTSPDYIISGIERLSPDQEAKALAEAMGERFLKLLQSLNQLPPEDQLAVERHVEALNSRLPHQEQ